MVGVGEHIYGLYGNDGVFRFYHRYVPCLGGRIATDVYDFFRSGGDNGFYDVFVHSRPGRVGYDEVIM